MATRTWDYWSPDLALQLPDVPEPIIEGATRRAAIELCQKGEVFIVDATTISVVAGTNTYAWTCPAGTEVVRPRLVWLDKKLIEPRTAGELSDKYGDFMQKDGAPEAYLQDKITTLILVPKPTVAGTITAKLAVKPTRAATSIEDFIGDKHYETILLGAKAYLFDMPGRKWADPGAAGLYQARFMAAITEAKNAIDRSLVGARPRVVARFL